MKPRIYAEMRNLCIMALDGRLSIEELFRSLPEEATDDFIKMVCEDLEAAVEHLPGLWGSQAVNWNAWRKTDSYVNLLVDKELLGFDNVSPDTLINCRSKCVLLSDLDEGNVRLKITELMANN